MSEDSDKKRVGVYVCHCGGNISDVVDVESVRADLEKQDNVVVSRRNMFMCSAEGQELIEQDIKDGLIDSVVVSACTPKLHELTFRNAMKRAGGNAFMLEQANIREQVSWTHTHDHAAATRKANALVRAASQKAAILEPLEFIKVTTVQQAIVVGGGIAGLRAALDFSNRGIKVVLLEKSPFLGGRVSQWDRIYPTEDGGRDLVAKLGKAVLTDPLITTHFNAEPIEGGGSLGDYWVKVAKTSRGCDKEMSLGEMDTLIDNLPEDIDNEFDFGLSKRRSVWMPYENCLPSIPAVDWENLPGDSSDIVSSAAFDFEKKVEEFEVKGGSIVLATGFDPYQPRKGEYGYGENPEVITLPQLLRIISDDGPTGGRLEINGKSINNIGFIHCVGSRQEDGINEPQEDGEINKYCSRVCCTATLHAQAELKEKYGAQLNLYDLYRDIRTYGRDHEDYYRTASENRVLFFRWEGEEPPIIETGNESALNIKVNDGLTNGEEIEIGVDLLVLSVGMVPHEADQIIEMFKLPRGTDRFLQEVHPKLRPVELAVEGILVAGTCQGPMTVDEATSAASAAAAKATNVLSKEFVELNPYVAEIDLGLCKGSGDCVAECHEVGAIKLVDGKAVVDHTICNGCGMCVGSCPNNAIDINGWTVSHFKALVEGLMSGEEV